MLLAISLLQLANGVLILIFLFLGFKFIETNWSYKISKPYAWDEAVKQGFPSKKLKKIERFYRDKVRFYTFWFQIERLRKEAVPGAFAEVGVYKGETARIIHTMDPARPLHLFDTFTGFHEKDLESEKSGATDLVDFSDTSVERVRTFIEGNENVIFHPGHFPETAENLSEEKFAFVHLDADLYMPTLAALRFFYQRLSPGGTILVHDYNHNWEGIRKAVHEFSATMPETIMEIPDWQGSVMIIRNKAS